MSKISTFAVRLQKLLEIKGITKAELSRITGINKSSITHYVKGDWEGKQDAVYAIARATGVSEAWLMGYDVPMTQKESRKQEIAQKMKNLRIRAGLTQLQVAEKLGITYEAISNYEQGTDSIEPHLFNSMCSIYDVAPISVLSPDEETEMYDALFEMMMSRLQQKKKNAPLYSSEALQLAKDYDSLDAHGKRMVRWVSDEEKARCTEQAQAEATERTVTKLVYINPAAAGMPLYAESDFEWMSFRENEVPAGADFGIRISGRSMEPTIADGAIVWVHKTADLESGAVGVFMLNDSTVCRRYFKNDDGTFRLESDNPEFDPVPVTEFDHVVPVGKVVGTV